MAIPSTGPISMDTIQNEYGGSNPISLSEYYRGGGFVPSGLTQVSSSGSISMSMFRGTQQSASILGANIFSIGENQSATVDLSAYGAGAKTLIAIDFTESGDGRPFSEYGSVTSNLTIIQDRIVYNTASDETSGVAIYRIPCGTASSVTVTRNGPDSILNGRVRGFLVSGNIVPFNTATVADTTSLSLNVTAGGITFLGTMAVFDRITTPSDLSYSISNGINSFGGIGGYRLNPSAGVVTHSWSINRDSGNSAGAGVSYSVS